MATQRHDDLVQRTNVPPSRAGSVSTSDTADGNSRIMDGGMHALFRQWRRRLVSSPARHDKPPRRLRDSREGFSSPNAAVRAATAPNKSGIVKRNHACFSLHAESFKLVAILPHRETDMSHFPISGAALLDPRPS